MFEDAVDKNKL